MTMFSHPDTHEPWAPPVDKTAELEAAKQDVMALAESLAADDARHDYAPERDDEHTAAVPAAPEPIPQPPAPPDHAPPQPQFAGTYAVYDDGHGGAVLVLAQATGETVQKHIPASMIKLAEKFGGGGIAGLFGGM